MTYQYRSLSSLMRIVVDGVDVEQSRHFRRGLGKSTKDVQRQLKSGVLGAVRAVLSGGTELVASDLESFPEMIRKGVLDAKRPKGRLDVQMEIELAKRYTLRTDIMVQNCKRLARLALKVAPGPAAQRFLGRVGRTYMLGLNPECVIMCRAALEQALTERFTREKKPFPPTKGTSELSSRLSRAEELGWLTRKELLKASDVRLRANKAIHEDPAVTRDAFGTVEATLELLATLYSH